MFSGSLRFNLDPFDEASDERIIDLIKKANLEYILEGKSKQELEEELGARNRSLEQVIAIWAGNRVEEWKCLCLDSLEFN